MTMDLPQIGELEWLMVGGNIYIGKDGEWARANSLFPTLSETYGKYAENKGPLSYSDVVASLKGLTQLEDESIDGKSYWHFQGSPDPKQALDEIPSGTFSEDAIEKAKQSLHSLSMDVLIDPDTLLPRRYVMDLGMEICGSAFSILMTMEFLEYDTDVDVPEEPANAVDFPTLPARSTAPTSVDGYLCPATPTPVPTATPRNTLPLPNSGLG